MCEAPYAGPRAASQAEQLPSLRRNRDFVLLRGGRTTSHPGIAASGVVFPLLVLDLDYSPIAASVAGAFVTAPYLLLNLPAGALLLVGAIPYVRRAAPRRGGEAITKGEIAP
jgi:hypothetical protein